MKEDIDENQDQCTMQNVKDNFKLNDICYFERNGNIYKGVIWRKPLKYATEYNVEYKSGSTIF